MRLSGFRINCSFPWRGGNSASASAAASAKLASLGVLAALLLCLLLPSQAFASYSNPSVNTVAQMRTDGSLHVVEQRTYSFEEDYSAVTWRFTGITDKQQVEVASVRIIQMDAEGNIVRDWDQLPEVAFQSNWRAFVDETEGRSDKVKDAEERLALSKDSSDAVELPKGDSFSFDKRRCELYVFLDSTENSTVIECDYAISNAALVYDDTAELYWDYVSAQPDVEMSNVRTQVQLPVPDGVEVVPGETVHAWGHGPEGTIDVRSDGTVHYYVPEVREGQYAQAHVLFPRSWLTNITVQSKLAKSGTRLDDALAEEATWTDTYSWGLVNSHIVNLALHVLCVLALAAAVVAYAVWGRERRGDGAAGEGVGAEGAGAACAPGAGAANAASGEGADAAGVDAAVLGRLLRWNQQSAEDFAATLRQLQQRGVISVSAEGPSPGDVRFRITPSAKSAKLTGVEHGAMELLFDTVGDGYQSVSLAELQRFCDEHPGWAREAMASWQGVLSEQVEREGLFDARSRKVARWLAWGAGVFAAFAVVEFFAVGSVPMAGALLATGAVVGAVAYCMLRRTPRGVELAECAEARAGERDAADADEGWQKAVAAAFDGALDA